MSDKVFCLYFERIFSLDIVFLSDFFSFITLIMLFHCLMTCISDRKFVMTLFSFLFLQTLIGFSSLIFRNFTMVYHGVILHLLCLNIWVFY